MSDDLVHYQDAIADSYGPQLEQLQPSVRGRLLGERMEQLERRRAQLWPMVRPEECTLEAMREEIDAVHRGPAPWLPHELIAIGPVEAAMRTRHELVAEQLRADTLRSRTCAYDVRPEYYELVTPANAEAVTLRLRRPVTGTELLVRLEADPIDYARIHRGRQSIPTQQVSPFCGYGRRRLIMFDDRDLPTMDEVLESLDRNEWLDDCRRRLQEALQLAAREHAAR